LLEELIWILQDAVAPWARRWRAHPFARWTSLLIPIGLLAGFIAIAVKETREANEATARVQTLQRFVENLAILGNALPTSNGALISGPLRVEMASAIRDLRRGAAPIGALHAGFKRLNGAIERGQARAAINVAAQLEQAALGVLEYEEQEQVLEAREATRSLIGVFAMVGLLYAWLWDLCEELLRRNAVEDELRAEQQRLEWGVRERTAVLMTTNTRLVEASQRLIEQQERTRQVLARELHDELGQQMAALLLNLRLIESDSASLGIPHAAPRASECADVARGVYDRIRLIAQELRPALLDSQGIAVALQNYAELQEAASGCHISVSADPSLNALPLDVATGVFRIAQEAIHSASIKRGAKVVAVILQREHRSLDLCVHDEGESAIGPPADGLEEPIGIRERTALLGGTLSIRAGRSGTEINVRVPLTASQVAARVVPARRVQQEKELAVEA